MRIVGIGASAGGLEALEALLGAATPGGGLCFVVATHQMPDRPSLLPALLDRVCVLPVEEAYDGVQLLADHVYVAPPSRVLGVVGDRLRVSEASGEGSRVHPIDAFLRSLAVERGPDAVGVVLSGAGTDGTLGLREIRDHGGSTVAQDPETAAFPGMPSSAGGAGVVDRVLAPADIPGFLRAPSAPSAASLADALAGGPMLQQIIALVRARMGHDFSPYKPTTIERRIERRMGVHGVTDPERYLELLRGRPDEVERLFGEILIGVTRFFRDGAAFEALTSEILRPALARLEPGEAYRVWVPACSTGEEAYSIAMAIREAADDLGRPLQLQLFATDLDPRAIDIARAGRYPAGVAQDLGPGRLGRFFVKENGHYRVAKELRELVIFSVQNITADPPFIRLDLVSCRNLLIYFDADLQQRVLGLFDYSLKPGGGLLLGTSESLGRLGGRFEPVDKKWKLFRRRPGASPLRAAAAFPTWSRSGPLPSTGAPEPGSPSEVSRVEPSQILSQSLLDSFLPPSLLVRSDGEIVFVHGRTGAFLEPNPGTPKLNILSMAREGLRLELASLLRQASGGGVAVERGGVRVRSNGGFVWVDVRVVPVSQPPALAGCLAVRFELTTDPRASAEGDPGQPVSHDRVLELERVLQQTKEDLQSAIEELEASNEELKSTNEELQSTNEELQSTNEELETSREEMQSLNEELQSVNAELRANLGDLSEANDDMRNLLHSTEIATLFLDNDLNIKRYTPETTSVIKLIPSDVGRSVGDLVSLLEYETMQTDAREVLRTLVFCQREVRSVDGRWYQMRILPYRTAANVIAGLVITFVDITRVKRAELVAQSLRSRVASAVRSLPHPAVLYGSELEAVAASAQFLSLVEDGDLDNLPRPQEWGGSQARDAIVGALGGQRTPPVELATHLLGDAPWSMSAEPLVDDQDSPPQVLVQLRPVETED